MPKGFLSKCIIGLVIVALAAVIFTIYRRYELAGEQEGDRCHLEVRYDETTDTYVFTANWVSESGAISDAGIILTQNKDYSKPGKFYLDEPFIRAYSSGSKEEVGQFSVSVPASDGTWYARGYLKIWDAYAESFPDYSPVLSTEDAR